MEKYPVQAKNMKPEKASLHGIVPQQKNQKAAESEKSRDPILFFMRR